MRCKWKIENSTWWIVPKILYSPNRMNRSNGQASTRVPGYREIFVSVANEMQLADRQFYLSDHPKILYSPNETNRSNRTSIFSDRIWLKVLDNHFTGAPGYCEIFVSVANEMQLADRQFYSSDRPKILYSPNGTNRSNRTSIFSDRIQLTGLDNPLPYSRDLPSNLRCAFWPPLRTFAEHAGVWQSWAMGVFLFVFLLIKKKIMYDSLWICFQFDLKLISILVLFHFIFNLLLT